MDTRGAVRPCTQPPTQARQRPAIPARRVAAAVALVTLASCAWLVSASRGDRERAYLTCVWKCVREDNCAGNPAPLPAHLALLGWDCEEECRYKCSHAITNLKEEAGLPVQQYHGRWAFTRVFGMQEAASCIFSILNAVPHWRNRRAWAAAPRGHPMASILRWYPWVGINCWFWSAAFHARDVWFTERLDYHCATLMVMFSLFIGVVRAMNITTARGQRATAAVLFGALVAHVAYLNLVKFDYGWNMKVSVAVVVAQVLIWVLHSWRTPRPYTWKCYVVVLGTAAAGLMELFDFPPVFNRIFDAHSLWHASTVPLGFLWWQYFCDDVVWDARVGQHKSDTVGDGDDGLPAARKGADEEAR